MKQLLTLSLCCVYIALYSLKSTSVQAFEAKPLPRIVYALYDKKTEPTPRFSDIHRALEMPLNWLGYSMEYIEISETLPQWRDDVAAVVLWLSPGSYMPQQETYLDWLEDGLDQDKKILIFGNFGINPDFMDKEAGLRRSNSILKRIGVKLTGAWTGLTYDSVITYKDLNMVEFERTYEGVLPSYYATHATNDAVKHLSVKHYDEENHEMVSDLIVTHPNGGYIADGYGFFYDLDAEVSENTKDTSKKSKDEGGEDKNVSQRWFVDPFLFIQSTLTPDIAPKPDVTTLTGRRIFYSHLDGDGWNNLTEIREFAKNKMISAEVLKNEIYIPYRRLPFTVAPIVSELDPECYGRAQSKKVAQDIFALPNVEPASHTYSHPLLWDYFSIDDPKREIRFLDKYPTPPASNKSVYEAISGIISYEGVFREGWESLFESYEKKPADALDKQVEAYFETPRSFACDPFDMTKEIKGSVDYLQKLAPKDKKIRLIQWSGDTTPAENALEEVSKHGFLNINGGDSRFDPEYPSYSYVAPIGLRVGKQQQIYSSNSNENTYTNLWHDRFFGFRHLVATVKNTETPRRISPFNIYYHSYSAEKRASLEALKQNLGYALSQDVIPVFASQYADVAKGYYTSDIIPLSRYSWRIENRSALQTMRFDKATLYSTHWDESTGVIGQQHYQGSLYVFLDPSEPKPVITLQKIKSLEFPRPAKRPYILESRWLINEFSYQNDVLNIKAQGFGRGVMQLYWPYDEKLRFKVTDGETTLINRSISVNQAGIVKLVIHADAIKPVSITLERLE